MKTYIGMLGLLGLVACGGGGGGSGAGHVPTNPIDTNPSNPIVKPTPPGTTPGTPPTTPIVDDPRSRDQGLSGPYSVSTVTSYGTKTNSITGNVEITPLTPSDINGATSLSIDATLSGRANAIRFATGSFDRYYSGNVTITDTQTIDASDGVPSSVDFTLSGDVTTQSSGDITLTVTDTVSYGIDQDAIAVVSGETSNLNTIAEAPINAANYLTDGNGPIQSFTYNGKTYTAQGSVNSLDAPQYDDGNGALGYLSSQFTWADASNIVRVPTTYTNYLTDGNGPIQSFTYNGRTFTAQRSVNGAGGIEYSDGTTVYGYANSQFTWADASNIVYAEPTRVNVGSFFITNEGTGTPDKMGFVDNPTDLSGIEYTTGHANLGGLNGEELRTAHQQGWTGKGTYIRFNGGDQNILDNIAPGAITGEITSIPSTYQVERVGDTGTGTNIGTTVTIEGVDDPVNGAAYAGTTSLVLHKFSTLNPDQANAVVYSTAKGRGLSISRALSPVGNLR